MSVTRVLRLLLQRSIAGRRPPLRPTAGGESRSIVAIFISLIVFLPLMGALLGGFMQQIAARIAGM